MKNFSIFLLSIIGIAFCQISPVIGQEDSTRFNKLVWNDEFDGNGAIDGTKWFHQTRLPNGVSWFNGELQHYTNRTENSYQANGMLYIMAKRESFTDQGQTKQYTSARLNSKFAFTYGRVEVRAKLPSGVGTWPAIWMLGKNINENGGYWQPQFGTTSWPACGEIDIMEHWGNNQNFVQSATHTPSSHGATVNKGGLINPTASDSFHIYTLEWTEEKLEFFLDGQLFYTYNPAVKNAETWPFFADEYILLNVAMVGAVAPNFTESPMILDYIRIYQEGATSIDAKDLGNRIEIFPNPVKNELKVKLDESLAVVKLTISDANGKLIDTITAKGKEISYDWSNYPAGLYFIKAESKDAIKVFKLEKE
ncbi:MAG: family 16 glycosylhydrolase [Bacteroidia bacterium]|nr:family 16 glycosylhydrolase [Bacteroidia bacterium]